MDGARDALDDTAGQLEDGDGRLDRMLGIQPANKEVFTGARIRRWECHDECLVGGDPNAKQNKGKRCIPVIKGPSICPAKRII